MKLFLLLAFAVSGWGQQPCTASDGGWLTFAPITYSQLAIASAATADVLSSRGGYEENPILGRGSFGARQAFISLGATGLLIVAERPLVRRYPRLRTWLTWINFGGAAVHTGAAIHNLRQ